MDATQALRSAIAKDGRPLAHIARAADVEKASVLRFVHGERSLTLTTADKLCRGLGLDVWLVPRGKAKGRCER